MLTVHIEKAIFHGFHGAYVGEHKAGNNFEVDLSVIYSEERVKFDSLEHIISYEDLYWLVKKRMNIPSLLLEEIADSIIRKIKHQYSPVREVKISIFKLEAPIENFQGRVGITLHKKFDD